MDILKNNGKTIAVVLFFAYVVVLVFLTIKALKCDKNDIKTEPKESKEGFEYKKEIDFSDNKDLISEKKAYFDQLYEAE
jgi:hypothetical protein